MQYLDYNTGTGELQNWLIRETHFDARYLGKCESIFSQGNGYLGVRNALEESYVGETRDMFVAGTFDQADGGVPELPNLPDVTAVDLRVNGYRFHLETGTVFEYSRTLNLKNGETVRTVRWAAPDGALIQMKFRRMVSLADRHIIAEQISILPLSGGLSLSLESGIDGRVSNNGTQHLNESECRLYDGKYMQMLSKTIQSGILVAIHSALLPGRNSSLKSVPTMDRRTLKKRLSLTLKQGEPFQLEKISCVHTGRDLAYQNQDAGLAAQLKKDGLDTLTKACAAGYDALLKQSSAAWEIYWETSDIAVQSETQYEQLALRFALYHLNIMAKRGDNRVSIGAKGLSGEGYKGHTFWDTDLFIQPYFIMTHPDTARTLLEYRYRNLNAARRNAVRKGYRGAMYPWECAWIDDGEATPLYAGVDILTGEKAKVLTGLLEHHITADVAYGVWQYFTATGDADYMERCGYEILLETAVFWGSRAEYNTALDRYEINGVIGPDEYKEYVDNNAYTNYMARWNMRTGLQAAGFLQKTQPELFRRLDGTTGFSEFREKIGEICAKIYLPVPGPDGMVPQTDGYLSLEPIDLTGYKSQAGVLGITKDLNADQLNRYMVSKQADLVMLMFLFEDLFSREEEKKNFLFYEAHTLHDSSLSKSIHSIVANRLGMEETAFQLFREALNIDLGPYMKSSDSGIHSASMGGIWQSAVFGFGGLRIRENGLHLDPCLPQSWKRLCFPLVWHGNRLRVTASANKAELTNNGGSPVSLYLFHERVTVPAGETVVRERGLVQ